MRVQKPLRFGYGTFIALLAAGLMLSCAVGVDEYSEGFLLATVTTFEVPDSSLADSIHIHLAGTIGESSAYSFNRIDTARTGNLFQVAVWGQYKESSKEVYDPVPPSFDTSFVLRSPLQGLHYINVNSLGGLLRDSTTVY